METRSAFNGGVTVYILDKISQKYISVLLGINQSINETFISFESLHWSYGPTYSLHWENETVLYCDTLSCFPI